MKAIKLYKVEVGVLLKKKHPDYESYSCVYDEKHAYYDENTIFFRNKQRAISFAKKYAKIGVVNTYGIVSELLYDPQEIYGNDYQKYLIDDLKSIKENGYIENYIDIFGSYNFDTDFVIFNTYKDENGKMKPIF